MSKQDITKDLPTQFAPARRSSSEIIKKQCELFQRDHILRTILDAICEIVMIVNSSRQVVFANKTARNIFEKTSEGNICGKRPGELLNCIHSSETEGGCGTTESCSVCGAVKAILRSQHGHSDTQEFFATQNGTMVALDLKVQATPVTFNNEVFSILSIKDISAEKRRAELERTIFSEIGDIAEAMKSISQSLNSGTTSDSERHQLLSQLTRLAEQVADDIDSIFLLTQAENSQLTTNPEKFDLQNSIALLIEKLSSQPVAAGKLLSLEGSSESVSVYTDKALLMHALENLLRNALEAEQVGSSISTGTNIVKGEAIIWIHNPTFMSKPIQLQLFNRSFSTKENGGGLGAYAAKLFIEKYLGGKLSLTSVKGRGVRVTIRLPLGITD